MDRLIKGNKAICEPSLTCSPRCARNLTKLRGNICVSVKTVHRRLRHRDYKFPDILDGFLQGLMRKRKMASLVWRIFAYRLPTENCKRENSQEDISPSANAESGVSFFYILIKQVYHDPWQRRRMAWHQKQRPLQFQNWKRYWLGRKRNISATRRALRSTRWERFPCGNLHRKLMHWFTWNTRLSSIRRF